MPTQPTLPTQPPAPPTLVAQATSPRRHDLDALRAGAMLLGIVLHAALSFFDNPIWPVQDRNRAPALALVVMAIHGFRMPLFFLLSGYFTAMLAERRGLGGLLSHRARRIALPLAVGMATIVPLVWAVSIWAQASQTNNAATATGIAPAEMDLWTAAARGNLVALAGHRAGGVDLNALDPAYRMNALAWAVVGDAPEAVAFLLEAGADPAARYGDGNTPLHTACFFGRAEAARLLIDAGAPVDLRSPAGETPPDSMRHGKGTVDSIAGILRISVDFEAVQAGREEIRTILAAGPAPVGTTPPPNALWHIAKGLLFEFPVFHHLWFLWFLCWLVPGYALAVMVLRSFKHIRLPRTIMGPATIFATAPACLLWLVPLTMLAQWPMHAGGTQVGFGPDTSVGLLPIPHVLAYYAIFFGAGALLFTARGAIGRLGRGWWLTLPLAMFVLAPAMSLGLKTPWPPPLAGMLAGHATSVHVLAVFGQSLYAWLMIVGLIGLFEWALRRERTGVTGGVRYLSDASYWLYVAHLPLVVAVQVLVRDLDLPAAMKFPLIVLVTTGVLLGIYQLAVRRTAIGRMLNGPRAQPGQTPHRPGQTPRHQPGGSTPGG